MLTSLASGITSFHGNIYWNIHQFVHHVHRNRWCKYMWCLRALYRICLQLLFLWFVLQTFCIRCRWIFILTCGTAICNMPDMMPRLFWDDIYQLRVYCLLRYVLKSCHDFRFRIVLFNNDRHFSQMLWKRSYWLDSILVTSYLAVIINGARMRRVMCTAN